MTTINNEWDGPADHPIIHPKRRIIIERKHNKKLVPNAKELRKNMTGEERHLWYDFLRSYPAKFVRQKILGHYIADFYCAAASLVVEIDGSQHYESHGIDYDVRRTQFLHDMGIKVLRIPNNEIRRNFQGVCEYIDMEVQKAIGGKKDRLSADE